MGTTSNAIMTIFTNKYGHSKAQKDAPVLPEPGLGKVNAEHHIELDKKIPINKKRAMSRKANKRAKEAKKRRAKENGYDFPDTL